MYRSYTYAVSILIALPLCHCHAARSKCSGDDGVFGPQGSHSSIPETSPSLTDQLKYPQQFEKPTEMMYIFYNKMILYQSSFCFFSLLL